MKYAFDIGGSKIEFGVFDDAGQIIERAKVETPTHDRAAFVRVLAELLAAADAKLNLVATGENARPVPVGISLAGGLDPQTGALITANIPGLAGWPLEAGLGEALGRSVRVENDADCFALAEALAGAAKGARTVFAIILGTGVGGGIVFDGRFIGGHSGIRGEWGHGNDVSGRLARHGLGDLVTDRPCGCGRVGCLDGWGAARGLERIYHAIAGDAQSSRNITDLARSGNALAKHAIEIFVDVVAGELSLMVNVLDPDCVPVGGGMASETALIAQIDQAVRDRVLGRYDRPLVVPGAFYQDGGLRGAALLEPADIRIAGKDA